MVGYGRQKDQKQEEQKEEVQTQKVKKPPEVTCIVCGETLTVCNDEGCGGQRKPNWRADMIAAALGKTPRLKAAQAKLVAAVLEARKRRNG